MFFIGGWRYYGKVDQVPGHLCVVTCFVHLFWFPIAPCEKDSLVVTERQSGDEGGLIPRSGKSVAFAYLRALLVVVAAAASFGALAVWGTPARSALSWQAILALSLGCTVLAVATVALLRHSYRLSLPTPERANQLRRMVARSRASHARYSLDDQVAFERPPRSERSASRDDITSRE